MKSGRIIAAVTAVLTGSMLFGCGNPSPQPVPGAPHSSVAGVADRYTDRSDKVVNFAKNETSDFWATNGYGNGGMFDCTWSNGNAVVTDGIMNMSVTRGNDRYYGAEYRSGTDYSYGYYSVCMKAAKCSGVISSFFLYTNRPQWDEIDLEFLGNDTTKVQFNYYSNGAGGHEYVHYLGFDASEAFHEYGFDWQKDAITWYVDGKAIYRAQTDIPSSPMKIMANVWNGTGDVFERWCGKLDDSSLPATASYQWIAYDDGKDNGGGQQKPNEPQKPDDPQKPDEPQPDDPQKPVTPIAPDRFTKDGDKIATFANGGSGAFQAADGWSNGGMFDCTWRSYNVAFADGNMNISITAEGNGYAAGEYRSKRDYSFGYYSVNMKAAKCSGVVSSFFTYTNSPRWDEIDIEFLGNDTTKVQFNYYTDGVGGHEYLYDLGFDASQGFHEYGFDWQKDSITWYVDGKAVYRATANIPQYAGKIMANVWNGKGVEDWIGEFTPSQLPITAQYKWIAYCANK